MSIFQYSRQQPPEEEIIEEEVVNPIFSQSRPPKKDIIPPVGIAQPELVDTFIQNIDDDEKVLEHIKEIEDYERETPSDTALREIKSHGARYLESNLGSIGDTQSFFEYMTGQPFPEKQHKTREDLGKFSAPDIASLEGAEPFATKSITTEGLRDLTKKTTGKSLEPKTPEEKISQEIASDFGSLTSPIAGELSWPLRILLPLSGQTTKQSLKAMGVGEKGQEIGKLATMGILSIANLGNARRAAGQAMNDARASISRNLEISAQPTVNAIERIQSEPWYVTGRNATKGPAFEMIDNILERVNNGNINAQEAMQLRMDINDARRSLGGFNQPGNPDKGQALRYLNQVDDALTQSLRNYGENVNPQWWRNYQLANEAYGITKRSEGIADLITSSYGKPMKSQTAKIVFGTGIMNAGLNMPLAGMSLGGLAAVGQSYKIINRMIRSPVLRRHYADVVRQASSGNSQLMTKALDKFDQEAKKLEKKEKP